MDAPTTFPQTLAVTIGRVMRPLFRLLLRNNMSFNAFVDIAKREYVDIAMQEFGIPGKKSSISRTAILSGLTRKDIQRIVSEAGSAHATPLESYNRAARVIAGWVRDADFLDPAGEPRALPIHDGETSFTRLVRRYSGDVPARAVLDELLRVKAIEEQEDGSLRLLARAYVPRASEIDKIEILGTDVADLITTIDHNIQHGQKDPRFQRKVMYDNLPAEAVTAFRRLGSAKSQALREEFDRWLAQHDRDNDPQAAGTGRLRAGIGIYYFEEEMAHAPKEH